MSEQKFKAIDFFCGGGGMTCGLRQAGIDVVAGIDFDEEAKETYEFNNKNFFIHSDIRRLHTDFFERKFNIQCNDDNLIFVGCSPCQYYSIINTDKNKSIKSKDLLMNFYRFVEYYRPGYVLVENVPGILTNKDSILPKFLKEMNTIGYNEKHKIVDMCYYGVPQTRERFSLIATRLNKPIVFPKRNEKQSLLKDFIGEQNGFPRLRAGNKDTSSSNHTVAGLKSINIERLRQTPHDGGNRLAYAHNKKLVQNCYKGKDNIFNDNYGRMWWNKPASTITTKFFSISNGRFGHPEEDRAISLREGATLQTFPKEYVFKTKSISKTAKLIGNAVPCEYARRLGEVIIYGKK